MIRLLLVLACLALFGLCVLGMRRGWRNRIARQTWLGALPVRPPQLGSPVLAAMTGLYVGTTTAEHWQDRVAAGGLGERGDATATLYESGLLIDRKGGEPVFIPRADIAGAGVGSGLAGKVMGAGGLLIVRWRVGGVELDTGLRADDKAVYPEWVLTIESLGASL